MDIVIVGDGVAGHTAAEAAREEDGEANIRVFTTEDVPFYDRIGLRAFIRGGRTEEDLVLEGRSWYAENDIDLHLGTKITAIDRAAKEVATAENETFPYDRLLLATGGTPRTLPIEEGIERVHHCWTLQDHGRPLKRHLAESETGAVIGGGLLGFDLIGSFSEIVNATYLIREGHWWPSVLELEGAELVHDAMREHGVDLRLNEEAEAMREDGDEVVVETNNGEHRAGVVGVAVGHDRNLKLAAGAGLETDRGIIVDEYLTTSDPDIYAAGDVAEYRDVVLGERNMGGSWVAAQEQGTVAGENLAGAEERLEFVDTYTVAHFGLNVASLGDPKDTAGKDVVSLVDEEKGRYRKLVLENGRIVGAAILGEMKWLYPLKQLILHKVDVSSHRKELENPAFDLNELLG